MAQCPTSASAGQRPASTGAGQRPASTSASQRPISSGVGQPASVEETDGEQLLLKQQEAAQSYSQENDDRPETPEPPLGQLWTYHI